MFRVSVFVYLVDFSVIFLVKKTRIQLYKQCLISTDSNRSLVRIDVRLEIEMKHIYFGLFATTIFMYFFQVADLFCAEMYLYSQYAFFF